jgi:hypothetical protein
MLGKKTKITIALSLIALAVISSYGITALAQTGMVLYIQRPRMRDITIQFSSDDNKPATCLVYHKQMAWQEYSYAMNFTINSGGCFNINLDNLNPIYKDMAFYCESGDRTMIVNSIFAMGAIEPPPKDCPVNPVCSTTSTIPLVCPTHSNGEYCNSDSECSSGYCKQSDHKCHSIPTTTTTILTTTTTISCYPNDHWCSHNSDCCSSHCHDHECHN